jgi:lipid A 3-O-deacylase
VIGSKARLTLCTLALLAGAALLAAVDGAAADDRSRFSALEENDSLYFNSDKHYTQGVRFAYLGPDITAPSAWNAPFELGASLLPVFRSEGSDTRKRRYALIAGQSIFTPKNITIKPPDRSDRPYAGWLYGGASLLQETDRRVLENLELEVGIVGPGALGRQVQNDFHQLIGIGKAQGWGSEIQHEVGAVLAYERLWRIAVLGDGANGVDVVPQLGAALGNIYTYGAAGGLLRIGKNLRADYGPVRVRPSLSGTDYFDGDGLDGAFGFYVFAGAEGRVVGRNVFLDGNAFRQSPSVEKKNVVADLQGGFTLFWSTRLRLDFSVVRRTMEFVGQRRPDVIGTGSLAVSW